MKHPKKLADPEPGKRDAEASAAGVPLLFEIINPSDAYTFLAPDLAIATIVTVYLGEGQYGARQIGGELEVPLMILGDPDAWFREHFNQSAEAFFESNGAG